jgi:hypothetical protein
VAFGTSDIRSSTVEQNDTEGSLRTIMPPSVCDLVRLLQKLGTKEFDFPFAGTVSGFSGIKPSFDASGP